MPKHGQLPPLPESPRRSLTPPARRQSGTFDVDSEAVTPARNPTAAEFAALASVFDELTHEQRGAFVELGFLFKALTADERKRLLDLAIEMNGLA